MNKGIRKVRKSIQRRKNIRKLNKSSGSIDQITTVFPQEEEKHGYYPSIKHGQVERNSQKVVSKSFFVKGLLSLALFLGVAFLSKIDIDLFKTPKYWTNYALTEDFPFARVHEWYQVSFGSPLSFTPENFEVTDGREDPLSLPVIGNVTEPFQTNGTGIRIAPKEATAVSAWNAGVVIFAGNDRETEQTVIIQHADNSKTAYGHLSSIDVHIYQFIGANEKIGSFNPTETNETIYFSIEKDNEFIDPAQVIKVDDQ